MINILEFDSCYQKQDYYKNSNYRKIDLKNIPNSKRYCENSTLIDIERRLRNSKKGRVTYIGSGSYHYITYVLIKDSSKPFVLIIFDHHTDMMDPPDRNIISCGSWVLKSVENIEALKKVVLVGVDKKLLETIPSKYRDKVCCICENDGFDTREIAKKIKREIGNLSIYISIDKDVLCKQDAVTDWDQGTMRLKELILVLKEVCRDNKVVGIDICGECPLSPTEMFDRFAIEANKKNNDANMKILEEVGSI